MMEPIAFKEKNDVLGPPPGKAGEITTLPIYRSHPGHPNGPFHISCWKATPEELEEINRTGVVWVHIIGQTTYPIALSGISPFKQEEQ
jgi:hypothetical protein